MPIDVSQTLRRALAELEAERGRLDRQISAIRAVIGGGDGRSAGAGAGARAGTRGRRRMSAEARRAVSQRMKAYWAQRRAQKAKAGSNKGAGKKKTEKAAS
jgi:hypothetical protein